MPPLKQEVLRQGAGRIVTHQDHREPGPSFQCRFDNGINLVLSANRTGLVNLNFLLHGDTTAAFDRPLGLLEEWRGYRRTLIGRSGRANLRLSPEVRRRLESVSETLNVSSWAIWLHDSIRPDLAARGLPAWVVYAPLVARVPHPLFHAPDWSAYAGRVLSQLDEMWSLLEDVRRTPPVNKLEPK
jgi:hypothetical protein